MAYAEDGPSRFYGKGFGMDLERSKDQQYEAPALEVLGTVHELTLLQDKMVGPTDGFTFMGIPITNRVTGASV
jgi:hypothetical protein